MHYTKPEINKIVLEVKPNTNASETGSCAGGHCVRSMYEHDH